MTSQNSIKVLFAKLVIKWKQIKMSASSLWKAKFHGKYIYILCSTLTTKMIYGFVQVINKQKH